MFAKKPPPITIVVDVHYANSAPRDYYGTYLAALVGGPMPPRDAEVLAAIHAEIAELAEELFYMGTTGKAP